MQQLRVSRGLSLSKLSRLVGVSRAYLCHLEQGIADNPSHKVSTALAEFYGISIEDLWGDQRPTAREVGDAKLSDVENLIGKALADLAGKLSTKQLKQLADLAGKLSTKQLQQIVDLMGSIAEANGYEVRRFVVRNSRVESRPQSPSSKPKRRGRQARIA